MKFIGGDRIIGGITRRVTCRRQALIRVRGDSEILFTLCLAGKLAKLGNGSVLLLSFPP